jgi:hypothetical protein
MGGLLLKATKGENMKNTIYSIMVASLALGWGTSAVQAKDKEKMDQPTPRAEQKESQNELEKRTRDINQAARKGDRTETALHAISVETGVPLERIREMHKKHSDAGVGGILNACVLADETKKDPEGFFKKHLEGKDWPAIARDNNVSTDKLIIRLDHLDRALGTGK